MVLGELIISVEESNFLKSLTHSAGRYPDFARILKENPTVEANLIDVANRSFGAKMSELIESTEVALGMMGFVSSRNYLAASIIRRDQVMTPWDDSLKTVLRYALEAEMYGGALAPKYFSAGFVFDFVLGILLKPDSEGQLPPTPKFVADLWKHSLQVCSIARQLSNRFYPNSDFEKDICLHALLHDIGKLVFYFLDDDYFEKQFKEKMKQKLIRNEPSLVLREAAIVGLKPASIELSHVKDPEVEFIKKRDLICFPEDCWEAEIEKYELSHDMMSHLILWTLGFFPDTHWIVLYHHQPFLAERRGSAIHQHATLVWLADQIARYREFHQMPRVGDKMISGWFQVVKPFLPDSSDLKFRAIVNSLTMS